MNKYAITLLVGMISVVGIISIPLISCSNDSGSTNAVGLVRTTGIPADTTEEPEGSPLELNLRPRLLMTPRSFAAIAERTISTHATMYSNLKARADELLTTPPKVGSYAVTIYDQSAILALVAAIEKHNGNDDTVYRDRAFVYAQHVLDTVDPWDLTSKSIGISHTIRGITGALSIIYDWLYSDLPPDLKQNIHNFLRDCYKGLHDIDRPSGSGQVRKSVYGSNYWLEWGAHPWFSIALHGDGLGDEALVNDAIAATRAEVHGFMIPALNILDGGLTNGWGYSLTGDMSFAFLNMYAWQTASQENIFSDDFALKDYTKFFLHGSKPDGALIKVDDTPDNYSDPTFPFGTMKFGRADARNVLILLMDIYNDGLAKYIVDKNDFRLLGPNSDRSWRNIIFYDPAVQQLLPSTLPKTRFFAGMGTLMGRSDWTEDALYYTFRNRDQYGSHSDAKQNSFTIYNGRAPLAINDGNYPDGASGAPSTKDYFRRTISSNSVLVVDTSETVLQFNKDWNWDGGQKYGFFDINRGTAGYTGEGYAADQYTQTTFDQSQYNTATNEFEGASTYTYIKGDATKGYTAKVKRFIREFVYIGDRFFVIFDRVGSSDAAFKKKWLLHSITEPVLDGVENFTCLAEIGEAACQGDTNAGISKSLNTTQSTITNGNGRLFSKTLLPASTVVRKVGGDGYKFWLDSINKDEPPFFHTPAVTGGWRLEISPQTPDNDFDGESLDHFLHVLEATVTTQANMTNVRLLSSVVNGAFPNDIVHSGNLVGAFIEKAGQNELVFFASAEAGLNNDVTTAYSVTTSAASRHTLFNLAPNSPYTVRIDGSATEITTTALGVLQFDDTVTGNHRIDIFQAF